MSGIGEVARDEDLMKHTSFEHLRCWKLSIHPRSSSEVGYACQHLVSLPPLRPMVWSIYLSLFPLASGPDRNKTFAGCAVLWRCVILQGVVDMPEEIAAKGLCVLHLRHGSAPIALSSHQHVVLLCKCVSIFPLGCYTCPSISVECHLSIGMTRCCVAGCSLHRNMA